MKIYQFCALHFVVFLTFFTNGYSEELYEDDLSVGEELSVLYSNEDGIRNGDFDGDGLITKNDLWFIQSYLFEDGVYPGWTADLDLDGEVSDSDLGYYLSILDGQKLHIMDVESVWEEDKLVRFEVEFMSSDGICELVVNDEVSLDIDVESIGESLWLARAEVDTEFVQGLDISAGLGLRLLNKESKSGLYTTVPRSFDGAAYLEEGKEEILEMLLEHEPEGFSNRTAIPIGEGGCCIKEIKIKPLMKGLRFEGLSDSGNLSVNDGKEKIKNRILPKGRVGVFELKPSARYVTLSLHDKDAKAKGIPLFRASYTCENLSKGIVYEDLPLQQTDSQLRPRALFEILSFKLERPCKKANGQVPVHSQARKIENFRDRNGRYTTGGEIKLYADYEEIARYGCNSACWIQYVQTVIELKRAGAAEFKELIGSDLHIDHNKLKKGRSWYCYPHQSSTLDENFKPRELVFRDFPHIKHPDKVMTPKGVVELKDGDVLRRRSVFYPQLVCLDPGPKVIAAFTYSLVSVFTYKSGKLEQGGESNLTKVLPLPNYKVPGKKQRKKLKEFLEKKKELKELQEKEAKKAKKAKKG